MNKIGKSLTSLTNKRERTQINKLKNKREEKKEIKNRREDMIVNTTEIQRFKETHRNNYIRKKWDNLEEMGKFPDTYNLQSLSHEEVENLNRCITRKKSESVTKIYSIS